jgi:WD40 repeat protein
VLDEDTLLQDRYRIVSQIGKGGMGTVYLARDENLGITVAVKQNFFADQRLIEAFKREARLLAGLRHAGLPRVIDHFIDTTGQFLVMEYIGGEDLGTILDKRKQELDPKGEPKPFEVDEVLRWAEQLLDTLYYLHTRPEPIIHRDVKPQNLKIAERDQIILLDFGLAKGKPLHMSRATTTGSIFGYTPNYAPIEQIRGHGTDPRSDLYGLAATIYHLITGVPPVDAATRADSHLGNEPDPLRPANEVNPNVPQDVSELLTTAMAQHRNRRPSSAAEMLQMLHKAKRSTLIDWQTQDSDERKVEKAGKDGESETLLATAEPATFREMPVPSQPLGGPGSAVAIVRSSQPQAIESEELNPQHAQPSSQQLEERSGSYNRKLLIALAAVIVVALLVVAAMVVLNKRDTPPVSSASTSGQTDDSKGSRLTAGVFSTPGKIFKVSLSDDGQAVASAGDETVVRLWRPDGATELIGHNQRGRSVAVSSDGQIVASGSEDGTIRLWRASDGQLINSFRGHSLYIFAMGFSPDGKTIFSASLDKTIKLWRATDGGLIKSVNRPEVGYLIVSVSPDLRLAGYYREDGSFKLWSLAEDALIRTLDGVVPIVNCGAFSSDGQMLALGSEDGAVQVWRVSDGRMMKSLGKFNESVMSLAFSANRQTVAAGLEHGAIKLWRISDGNLIKSLEGHTQSVDCLAFRSDGHALVSGSDDKTVRVWDLEEKK